MNIVFDLGGVVFNWQPDAIVRSVFPDTSTRALAKRKIIEHNDWLELDRGTLSRSDAIARSASRTGLSVDSVTRLFDAVPPSLTPIEETLALIRALGETEHRLFVLSNMGLETMAYLERHYDIWDAFCGVVVSSRIGKVKPELDIYHYLLQEHRLTASATVFIDDIEENLLAAATLGIQTIQFVGPAQCRRDLEVLNCL
ncbi:MAG: HAD family phosphatase [Woeseiaceae bacterium]